MRKRGSHPPDQVFAVTGLPASLRDDQSERMRRYLVSMGIRTACFILAVVAIVLLHWTAVGWVLVGAAVILPYVAVVMANATRSRRTTDLGSVLPDDLAPAQISSLAPDDNDASGTPDDNDASGTPDDNDASGTPDDDSSPGPGADPSR